MGVRTVSFHNTNHSIYPGRKSNTIHSFYPTADIAWISIKFSLFPDIDIDTVHIKVELPVGSRFEETVAEVVRLEDELRDFVAPRDLLAITSQVGHHDTDFYGATEGRNPAWALIAIQLEPLGRRLIPVRSVSRAFLYGLVWGWLPCGLVYWALLIAAGAGDPSASAIFMIIFGLATLPGMVATGMLAGWIQQIRRLPYANRIAGLLLIILGLVGVFYAFEISVLPM